MRIYSKILLIVGLSFTLTNVSKAQLDIDSFLELNKNADFILA